MPTPHVFILRGDITHFACDAWLLPTDRNVTIEAAWRGVEHLDERARAVAHRLRAGEHAAALEAIDGEPIPILTAVPDRSRIEPEHIPETNQRLRSFVAEAVRVVRSESRALPLLAVPTFASGLGGGPKVRDELLADQLRVLREEAAAHSVDIAVVIHSPAAYAFAQSLRREDAHWPDLSEAQLAHARRLAGFARGGRLVPFLGAGTSISAGGLLWDELLATLAERIGLGELADAFAKSTIDPLDKASLLARRAPGFNALVATEIARFTRYGLAPALLASLTAEQAITLNYDALYETAAADAGVPRTVITTATAPHADRRWLLKLHGDVADPDSIVLTRNDYLGYDASRAALSAMVTATMATRHILFVGFGLTDPHFHEIVHDVTTAFPAGASDGTALATALTLHADPIAAELWAGRLDLVPFEGGDGTAEAARRLEIMLDAMLAFASDGVGYLLADGHDAALPPAELQLRARLKTFLSDASDAERATAAWREIERLVERFGG